MNEDKYFISQIKSDGTILSPNDWLKKVGCKMEKGEVIWPREDILIPLSAASRAVEIFNASSDYNQKLESALLIGLTVRIAETALFNKLAVWFTKASNTIVCSYCIRNSDVFNTLEIKKYRNLCNSEIIHVMENQTMINPEHLIYAIKYYDEVLKLPLFNEIVITSKFEITCCDRCSEKNGIMKDYLITSGKLKGTLLTSSDYKNIKAISQQ